MWQKIKLGFVGVLFIIMFAIGIPALLDSRGQSAPTHTAEQASTPTHSDAEVYATAEAILQKFLKAPSTANFASMSEAKFQTYSDGYRVDSYVDAQNSFGAMIRSNWTVLFSFGSGNVGEPVLVVLDGKVLYKDHTE